MFNRKKLLTSVLCTIPLAVGSVSFAQQNLIFTGFNAADAVPLKDLDGHFPFAVPESKEAWESRASELRRQIKVSLGLMPMPPWHRSSPRSIRDEKWMVMQSKSFTSSRLVVCMSPVVYTTLGYQG